MAVEGGCGLVAVEGGCAVERSLEMFLSLSSLQKTGEGPLPCLGVRMSLHHSRKQCAATSSHAHTEPSSIHREWHLTYNTWYDVHVHVVGTCTYCMYNVHDCIVALRSMHV